MLRNILCILACFLTFYGTAQSTLIEKKTDALSERLLRDGSLSGVNILIIQNGKILYNKAFGYANPEAKEAMRTDHIFRIASQTKAVTSVAVLMLMEEGMLLLDDPVSKYIPAFKAPQVLQEFRSEDSSYTTIPAHREITIRDLLTHTSGISYPIISGDPVMSAVYAKAGVTTGVGNKEDLKDKIQRLAAAPLARQPGETFIYGLNTDVLGYLVEVVSGTSLEKFFREKIFTPLEMDDTYFYIPAEKAHRLVALTKKTAEGFITYHEPIFEGSRASYPLEKNTPFSGGAGLSSTTADYSKFLQMLLNGGSYNGKRILGAHTVELMMTNQLLPDVIPPGASFFRFGLGTGLVTEENKYAHITGTGTFYWSGAFNTHYWADPQEKIIGLVYTQEYLPASYNDLGTLYKNTVYANLE